MPAPAPAPTDILVSIAHELRQPLSTIESIAFYLGLVSPRNDEKVRQQLARLQQLVEQSNWILTNGLQLAHPPVPAPAPLDLEELITQAVASRPASMGPPPSLELAGHLPLVTLDLALTRALLENVLVLFRQIATEDHPVKLCTSTNVENDVLLEFKTATPGYRSESSLGPGAALALQTARRMVIAQGGSLDFHIDPETGISLRVMLR